MQIAALTGSVGRLPGIVRNDAAGTPAPAVPETPQEPYFSPVFRFDKAARVLVFQFRDSETGNVTRQYPSEKVVKLYRDNAPKDTSGTSPEPRRAAETPAPSGESTESSSAPESAPADTGSAEGTERVRVTA